MPTKGLHALGDDDFFPEDLPDPGSDDSGTGIFDDTSSGPGGSNNPITDDPSVSNVSVDANGNTVYTNSAGDVVTITPDMITPASTATASAGANQVDGNLTGAAGAAVKTAQPNLQSDIASAMSSGNISALSALARTALQVYQANGANSLQMQRLQNSFALQQQRLLNSRTQMPILLIAGVAVAFLVMRGKH